MLLVLSLFAAGCTCAATCRAGSDCPVNQQCVGGFCGDYATAGTGPGSTPGPGGETGNDAGADAGTSDAGTCAATCSDDLQSITDCHGVTRACPAGQGCTAAGCGDPCVAATEAASATGCDFYVNAVPPQVETVGSCYAVLVANTWNVPVRLTVRRGTQTFDVGAIARIPHEVNGTLDYDRLPTTSGTPTLPAGTMAVLFLAQVVNGTPPANFIACPVSPAMQTSFQLAGTGLTTSFEITATAPVIAYDIFPYGGAASHVTSASLLLPTSAWGTNYLGVTPTEAIGSSHPYLQIYGQADNTQIAITAPVAIAGGVAVNSAPANSVAHYSVNRGEVLQLLQSAELGGALVRSDKPIAVWGGHTCMNVPSRSGWCDSAHQQLPAVPLLGNEYLAVRPSERVPGEDEDALWRLVGAVDGTQLTFEPRISQAPSTLSAGQTVTFAHPGPFRVTSQDANHIFSLSQLMTGGEAHGGMGDPEFVNTVPPQQFLRSYLFLTDATYTTTELVFVRGRGSDGRFHDVSLDCAGVLTGWKQIANTAFEFTRVSWLRSSAGCGNGVHTATSTVPFGLTVWGTEFATSYAFPAGMGVRSINTVVVGPDP
ncbi:MAG: IgGFc-binding protein [Archangium sp.]